MPPAVTAFVRINGGEVIEVSQATAERPAKTFSARLSPLYTVLEDPTAPDGLDIFDPSDPDRTRRTLNWAKYGDIGANTIRNATQPEIDAWPAAEADDIDQEHVDKIVDNLDNHPHIKRQHRAEITVNVIEFNKVVDKINEILDAIDAAGSFPNMKTRIGNVDDLAQLNVTNIRTRIKNRVMK